MKISGVRDAARRTVAVPGMRDNGQVGLYRDDGIVLRTQDLGEADRIITVLARRTGRVRAVGKGVRRTKSKFGARLEPFTHVDLQLYTGRSLDVITQADTVRAYGEPLAPDYPRYTSGTAMLETAERFTPEEKEPALRQFLLLVGGLRAHGGPDGCAAAGGLGTRGRGGAPPPGRVQRPGRCVPAVAPGAFHSLASPRGACVRHPEDPT